MDSNVRTSSSLVERTKQWKVGRVVYCTGLENRRSFNGDPGVQIPHFPHFLIIFMSKLHIFDINEYIYSGYGITVIIRALGA